MPYVSGAWAYKDPLLDTKLNQMIENSVWISEHRVLGCHFSVAGTSTVTMQPGKIELDGSWLIQTTTATLTAEDANDWYSASGGEAVITAWYVVAYNSAGNDFDIKFRTSGPAYSDTSSGTSTGDKLYDRTGTTWLRYLGKVNNNTASELFGSVATIGEIYSRSAIIKAWVNFNGVTATNMINDSFGVDSITDNAEADYTINWSKDFASVNYVAAGFAYHSTTPLWVSMVHLPTVSGLRIRPADKDGTFTDAPIVMVMALGEQ